MDALEPKKLALIRILQIFQQHSDYDHPLTQEDIAAFLEQEYGIIIERKAIGRNISLLKEAGYQIESGRNGSYLDEREFEDSELHMLIDGVLNSKYITAKHSKDLIEKLCGLSNKYFRAHVKNVHSVNDWSKTDNQALFYNIERIDDAIEQGRQIRFDYNKYGVDKKLHRTATHRASPYQLVLHNQRYYLMAYNERWHNIAFYRVDHITNMTVAEDTITPLTDIKGYENGINYRELATALPYMFTDRLEKIVFYAAEGIVDQIVDWFGQNANIERENGRLKVTVKASPTAMEFWAMQYLNYVEVVTPAALRSSIQENLKNGWEKYHGEH
ncbi:MAG: WYL domain-containing transcriptional regulator [Clostridia bacterium]|nr:WYL domain-containing transcriptional regulator [Clostridia bacterium]